MASESENMIFVHFLSFEAKLNKLESESGIFPCMAVNFNVCLPHYNFPTVRAAESVAAQQHRCELSKGLVSRARMLSFAHNRRLLMNTAFREEFEKPPEY